MKQLGNLAITAVILAAIGFAYWFVALRDTSPAQAGGPGGAPGLVVEATEAIRGTSVRKLKAVGTLASNQSVTISPEIAGRITSILFENGEQVTPGERLIELDQSVQLAELADAEATLELARREYARADDLVERGTVPVARRDEAVATLRSAEARVNLAKAQLAKMDIDAPFEGVLGIRNVDVGDFLGVGEDIVNLEQIVPIKVTFEVPERFLQDVTPGKELTLRSDAYAGEKFAAHISAIDPLINPRTRSIRVEALVGNEDLRLRPGQFVSVTIRVDERRDVVFIPEQAVVPNSDEPLVYRVVGDAVELVPIETGARIARHIEVRAGLAPGDVVVTAGQQRLADGTPVTVTEPTYVPPSPADEEIQVLQGS